MAGPPKEVKEAWCLAFEETFFNIMVSMIHAESVEADFEKLQAEVRLKTKEQLKRIARLAGEYYADHANPNPGEVSEDESAKLMPRAIEYALKKFSNEEKN